MGWRLRRKLYNLWSGKSNTDGKTLGKNLKYFDRRRYQRERVEKNTYLLFPSRNFTKKAHPAPHPQSPPHPPTPTAVHVNLGQEGMCRS